MAKKSKSSRSKSGADTTTDAVETPPETVKETSSEVVEDTTETPAEAPAETPEETAVEPARDAVDEAVIDQTPEPDPAPAAPEPAQVTAQHHDSASNNVLLPAILGGLIAAGIGFGVAYYLIPRADPNLNEMVATNTGAVEELRSEVAALAAVEPEEVDLSGITDDIAALQADLTAGIEEIDTQIASFDDRLTTLEKQPSGDGTLQEAALEAYQRELDELRAKVEEQAGAAFAQLEETRAEAAAIEQAALDAAREAQIRAALAQIQTGLNDGTPMDTALADLEAALGEPVPAGLAEVAEGAPTLAKLQADFPNAARSALSAVRSGGESGEETSALGAFFREQFNVRSVAPRDGDDADAVLSRAQAAVSEGQLQAALDEITALPDVAQARLAEWVAVAETRVAAVNAADDISLSLNVN